MITRGSAVSALKPVGMCSPNGRFITLDTTTLLPGLALADRAAAAEVGAGAGEPDEPDELQAAPNSDTTTNGNSHRWTRNLICALPSVDRAVNATIATHRWVAVRSCGQLTGAGAADTRRNLSHRPM